jgi:hypothetical protein
MMARLNIETTVQECDARMLNRWPTAWLQKITYALKQVNAFLLFSYNFFNLLHLLNPVIECEV